MVEVDGKRSRLLSLFRSLSPLKIQRHSKAFVETTQYAYERTAPPFEVLTEPFCPMCLNLWEFQYDQWCELEEPEEHRMPAKEILRTAGQGCSGCEIIAWALEPYIGKLEAQGGEVYFLFDNNKTPDTGIIEHGGDYLGWSYVVASYRSCYYGSIMPIYTDKVHAELKIQSTPHESGEDAISNTKNSPSPWQYIKSAAKTSNYTGSPAAIGKARNWYRECSSSHKECLQNFSSQLPTRVICIEGHDRARLHISGDEYAEYACLSHCWGGQAVLQTSTKNLQQYIKKLPWKNLPKTFQHAIQFAHALGFTYLWIDSLCIIQDSIDDWRHEGSRMSKIFANASLTLSATWAANPHQGCFATLDERYVPRTRTFTNGNHETYELHCHEWMPELKTPLQARGWVFQERMLSRRIVHFMEQELWWECRGCFQCECMEHNSVDAKVGMALNRTARLSKTSSVRETKETWEEIVQVYTSKALTYSSDIFPALQGLAKLAPSYMGRYLAGHWEGTFPHSLCWYILKPTLSKPMEWRAPSWSWAAAQSQVNWDCLRDYIGNCSKVPTHVIVLDAMTQPFGDDPMGQISSGAITLRGKCLTGQIQTVCLGLDIHHHILTLKGAKSRLSLDKLLISVRLDNIGLFDHEEQIVAMKIFNCEDSHTGTATYGRQFWLILRAKSAAGGEYVRIGMFVVRGHDNTDCPKRELNALYAGEAMEMDLKIV